MGLPETNQPQEALRDLAVVAGSDDRQWRTSAAIQMSYIYWGVKDFNSLLDVLNQYRFLFDPMYAGFASETRCHAYMELGELQKALDDCTMALKIVSSPNAYRWQQELIRRLGKQ